MKYPAYGYPIDSEEQGNEIEQKICSKYHLEEGEFVLVDGIKKRLLIRTDDQLKLEGMLEVCGSKQPTCLLLMSCHLEDSHYSAPFVGPFTVKSTSEIFLSVNDESTPIDIAEKVLSFTAFQRNADLVAKMVELQIMLGNSIHEKRLVLYAVAAIKVICDSDKTSVAYTKALGIQHKSGRGSVVTPVQQHINELEKLLRPKNSKPLNKKREDYEEKLEERVDSLLKRAKRSAQKRKVVQETEEEPVRKKRKTNQVSTKNEG